MIKYCNTTAPIPSDVEFVSGVSDKTRAQFDGDVERAIKALVEIMVAKNIKAIGVTPMQFRTPSSWRGDEEKIDIPALIASSVERAIQGGNWVLIDPNGNVYADKNPSSLLPFDPRFKG